MGLWLRPVAGARTVESADVRFLGARDGPHQELDDDPEAELAAVLSGDLFLLDVCR